jgi:amino acid transporter
MLIAIGITLYFWRTNIIGIGESSAKAMRIMQLTTVMGLLVIGWTLFTIALRPETHHLPPFRPVLTPESTGWLTGFPRIVGLFGILIAFGHSLLAMSGEESLAQVNRELAAPKTKNLLRAGLVIFVYSLLLTSLISFFAVMVIPDSERIRTTVVDASGNSTDVTSIVAQAGAKRIATRTDGSSFNIPADAHIVRESGKYTDNLISGLVMHLSGPRSARLALQAFVVFVGFLILAGAVNTSIVGSNGVLNRLAEDGVLTPWFLHPQQRFGTTHRLINLVAILQIVTIVASMGDVYTLGEAYAFGVIWSFVFKTMAMIVLRFVDKSPRTYEVPLNIRISRKGRPDRPTDRIDLPIGITLIFLVLLGTALINLLTKKVATIWGVGFTAAFLAVFIIGEQLAHRMRRGQRHQHLEQFNQTVIDGPTPEALGLVHAGPVLVAIRNPNSMPVLDRVLRETDTNQRDIVAITCKVLPPLTPGITTEEMMIDDFDREVLTRVVNLAEEAGKPVYPLVIPTNNPLYAIATAARDLHARELVLGASEKSSIDVQLEQFALAWGMAMSEGAGHDALAIRIIGKETEARWEM